MQVLVTKECRVSPVDDFDGDYSAIHGKINDLLPIKSLSDMHHLLDILDEFDERRKDFVSHFFSIFIFIFFLIQTLWSVEDLNA